MGAESELQMVMRHVMKGRAAIARQTALVAKLAARGEDVTSAVELLDMFETIQAEHLKHLARLQP